MTTDTPSHRLDTLIIDRRFNGPTNSGNGGWVAGSLARLLGSKPVSVSLRAPAPLDQSMWVRWRDDGSIALETDAALIAEACIAPLQVDIPKAPDPEEAEAAGLLAQQASSHSRADAPYAHCFGCGFARSDGLSIIPGPVGTDGIVATTWTPPTVAADSNGQLTVETTWAALDCSAGLAWGYRLPSGTDIVTVRMTAVIDQPLQLGQRYTVIGWPILQDGRKLHAGTAIFNATGKTIARSRQLWLIQRPR
jgi:hypothetical protein